MRLGLITGFVFVILVLIIEQAGEIRRARADARTAVDILRRIESSLDRIERKLGLLLDEPPVVEPAPAPVPQT